MLPPNFPHMEILEIFLLFHFSVFFPIVRAGEGNICRTTFCGDFPLDYPFKTQNSQPQNDCNYINLNCDENLDLGTPIVNLPYEEDFYVRYIEYHERNIMLYDPGNCLMRRLMKNLNLSSSPFKAIAYENYTFYMCPSNSYPLGNSAFRIGCLSNLTNSTVATSSSALDVILLGYGCKVIGSWMLPVSSSQQFEFNGIDDDLYLTWNPTTCKACGSKDTFWTKFVVSPYFILAFVVMSTSCMICLLKIIELISGRNETTFNPPAADVQPESTTAATAPPQAATEGLDEFRINSCTKMVVLSRNVRNKGTDSNTCSICLEIYLPQDSLRSIAKCEHCFHAECIEMWLRKKGTCPVCRTVLADVVEL